MKKLFQKILKWIKARITAITPGRNAVKGASISLFIFLALFLLITSIIIAYNTKDPWYGIYNVLAGVLTVLGIFLATKLLRLLLKIPRLLRIAIISAFVIIPSLLSDNRLATTIIIVVGLLGASLFALFKTGFKKLSLPKKIVSVLGLIIGFGGSVTAIIFYIPNGIDVKPLINAAYTSEANITHMPLESPAKPGAYKVNTLFYGSGKDKHRKHFGEDVDVKTDSVNGVAFLDNWDGISGWWRTNFFGFDSKALPLNAQVWYPDGEGPFPLVLIVHGNHSMQDFSDIGYAYLGELLASRGMIAASVDENFINSSWSDLFGGSLTKENDARGWILLEHLRLWHEWNDNPESLFYNKIDTDKLSLIGHSRGGEAVGHAALMNTLPYYSDDATITLNYNFNIKSIIAVAPVDGQYAPGSTRTKLKDIDYFTIHGAQDADVTSFAGSRQFDRITYTDSTYHFKSGLYIYGANHGQFNTSWGNNDVSTPFVKLLNLKQLLSGEEQREIAKVYISAFLETTLNDNKGYLPLFTDHRTGKNWLPETIYLSQFEDSNTSHFATFDEDFNVTTASIDAVSISSERLTVWREKQIPLKGSSKVNRGLFLGWHYKKDDIDTWKKQDTIHIDATDIYRQPVHDTLIASYSINFNKSLIDVDSSSVLVFSMSESKLGSNPKAGGKWIDNNDSKHDTEDDKDANEVEQENNTNSEIEQENNTSNEVTNTESENNNSKEEKGEDPINFSISVTDSMGNQVYFPISDFSTLQRRLGVKLWKQDYFNSESSENVFQTYRFPVEQMLKLNPDFNPSTISEIRFIFDKMDKGVILIDDIGFTKTIEHN